MNARVDGRPPARTSVVIRPMQRRHLREVVSLEQAVYDRPWSLNLFEGELSRSNRSYVVARVGSAVVGYAGVLMIADDGHISTVVVDPSWRRRGVATALMVSIVGDAIRMGANQMTLEVRMSNAGAQDLYKAFGFVPAGARKGYYADNGEDALVMWAHDVNSRDYQDRLDDLATSCSGRVDLVRRDRSRDEAQESRDVTP